MTKGGYEPRPPSSYNQSVIRSIDLEKILLNLRMYFKLESLSAGRKIHF